MKWVYKLKEQDGEPVVYKSRLVPLGCNQIEGKDYIDTYAPVSKYTSFRVLMSIAAVENLEVHQMDVHNAFPNAVLKEDIYVSAPPGYTLPQGKVYKLKKALYGLKQSPLEWHKLINEFILSQGFTKSAADPCIYIKKADSNVSNDIFVGLYVDDIIICGPSVSVVSRFKKSLSSRFKCKDLGEIRNYLGMQISRDRVNKTITISMPRYIDKILHQFRMDMCSSKDIPYNNSIKYNSSMSPNYIQDVEHMKNIPYNSAIGALMFLVVTCRPDLSYIVHVLSRFMQDPGIQHWEGVKNVLKYLKGTTNVGITFGGSNCNSANKHVLFMYSDSDWAGCKDTYKSTSGYVAMFNGGPIQWKAKLQSTVAQSSSEAEYIAVSVASNEVIWLKRLLADVGRRQFTTIIYEDNSSAINISNKPKDDKRTRHILIKYHLIKERVANKDIKLVKIDGKQNPADLFTKPEDAITFKRMRRFIMLV
jgi:hypothetical protein